MQPCPTLTVDLDAITANYRLIRKTVSPANCAAVIKANAYGLGAEAICRHLLAEQCNTFFFAHLPEALPLTKLINAAGGQALVLNGLGLYASRDFAAAGVIPVLNSLAEARQWIGDVGDAPAALHLDTGMNRLGLPADDDSSILELTNNGLKLVHLMSHLACADQPEREENQTQLRRFQARAAQFDDMPISMTNSAGCFLGAAWQFAMARPGLALYGAQPVIGKSLPLQIPYRFEAPVLQIRQFNKGDGFGYAGTHKAATDGYSATIGAGYTDGIPRGFSNTAHVWIDGLKMPIIGRVSMDSFVADISAHSHPHSLYHQAALIYGQELTIDEQAASAGLSSYELLTRIGGRTITRHVGFPTAN
ncbi:MAG: alanine racemase [Hyphobacterium sp.]|nr:MAG: alanine racemase [Hyphobacterium sp.]